MAEKKPADAIPFLRWSGKGGSGMSAMNDRDDKGNTTPWGGARLADELNSHAKAGNTVTFGAIHNGQVVGEAKPAAKKAAAAKPAAKPAAKAAAPKAAAKPAAKPAAKGKPSVIATKAAEGLSKAKRTRK